MAQCNGELDLEKSDFIRQLYIYKTAPCPHLLKTEGKEQTKSGKKLQPYCFYCTNTVFGARKIARQTDFTGRTPKWCPKREKE